MSKYEAAVIISDSPQDDIQQADNILWMDPQTTVLEHIVHEL
jgi:hypothetical protein